MIEPPAPKLNPRAWECPHCGHHTTITEHDVNYFGGSLDSESAADGYRVLHGSFTVCPNQKCKKFVLTINLFKGKRVGGVIQPSGFVKSWRLIPPSTAKVLPDYIPQALREDYEEACAVLDESPKASATLARRCLQGMIRDFWGVKRPKLIQEIEEIKDKVDPLTWKAIDGVRKIGNIGAHMEEDVNLIIDVEPEEARKLIWLLETLFKDWYITRHEREENLRAIAAAADGKKALAATAPSTKATP